LLIYCNYSAYQNRSIDLDFDEIEKSDSLIRKNEKTQSIPNNQIKSSHRNFPMCTFMKMAIDVVLNRLNSYDLLMILHFYFLTKARSFCSLRHPSCASRIALEEYEFLFSCFSLYLQGHRRFLNTVIFPNGVQMFISYSIL
jgi:hypothetical protein